jgi:putative transposase
MEESIEIKRWHISSDHIHLFLSYPPKVCISKLVQRLKGITSNKMLEKQKFAKTILGSAYVGLRILQL